MVRWARSKLFCVDICLISSKGVIRSRQCIYIKTKFPKNPSYIHHNQLICESAVLRLCPAINRIKYIAVF